MAGEMTRKEIRKRELVLGKTPCGFCHWRFGGTREGLGIVTLDLPEAAGQSLGMIGQGLRRRGERSRFPCLPRSSVGAARPALTSGTGEEVAGVLSWPGSREPGGYSFISASCAIPHSGPGPWP